MRAVGGGEKIRRGRFSGKQQPVVEQAPRESHGRLRGHGPTPRMTGLFGSTSRAASPHSAVVLPYFLIWLCRGIVGSGGPLHRETHRGEQRHCSLGQLITRHRMVRTAARRAAVMQSAYRPQSARQRFSVKLSSPMPFTSEAKIGAGKLGSSSFAPGPTETAMLDCGSPGNDMPTRMPTSTNSFPSNTNGHGRNIWPAATITGCRPRSRCRLTSHYGSRATG